MQSYMILLLDVVKRVMIQQLNLNPNFLTQSKNGLIHDLILLEKCYIHNIFKTNHN